MKNNFVLKLLLCISFVINLYLILFFSGSFGSYCKTKAQYVQMQRYCSIVERVSSDMRERTGAWPTVKEIQNNIKDNIGAYNVSPDDLKLQIHISPDIISPHTSTKYLLLITNDENNLAVYRVLE